MPMATLGFYLGMNFLEKIDRVQFLRIVYLILLLIGTNMLLRNIPLTPEMMTNAAIGTSIVVAGYLFSVLKKRKANVEKLQAS